MEYPFATGYSERNLNYMKQFAERIPSEEILQQGVAKINWRSITFLINQAKNTEEFVWYAGQTIEQGWSSTVLRHQIESGLYGGQVLVEKNTNYKIQLANPLGEQAEEIIKDPYVFDFIPAAAPLLEKDLEDAMVAQITRVLMEFGSGFSFLGRQYPIHVGEKDYYIDLLFYNVKLHCYFVVELKTVDFEPEFAGKLSFYLSAVDGELKSDLDNPTLGLLLCKGKDKVVGEYALQDINKPIGISEYRVSDKMNPAILENLPSIEDIENRIKLKNSWSGYAFEQVCLNHIPQIKGKLGISGILSNAYAWSRKKFKDSDGTEWNGGQIDLIIDRNDDVMNICEMKYSADEYSISPQYAKDIKDRMAMFIASEKTRKDIRCTFVTTFGVKKNPNSDIVASEVVLDDLFK